MSNGSAVERRENGAGIQVSSGFNYSMDLTFDQTMTLAGVFAKSGFFGDVREAAQAAVKMLAGRELGIPPIASMTDVYVIKSRVSLSAKLQGALVKKSGRYNYRVDRLDDEVCQLTFFEKWGKDWQQVGESKFTIADARRAETQNLGKFPRNMLFARAMSNGVKWYCPDLTFGTLYDPSELGVEVDEDGQVIDAKPFLPAIATESRTGSLSSAPTAPQLQSAAAEPAVEGPSGEAGTAGPVIATKAEVDAFVALLKKTFKVTAIIKSFLGRELPYPWDAIPIQELREIKDQIEDGVFDTEKGERIPQSILFPAVEEQIVDTTTGEIETAEFTPDYDPFNDPSMPAAGGEINVAFVKKEIGETESRLWPIHSEMRTETQNIRETLGFPSLLKDLDAEQLVTYRDHLRGLAAHKGIK